MSKENIGRNAEHYADPTPTAAIQVLHLLHERTVEDGVAANRPRQRLAAVGWYGHWRVRLRQDLGACTDMPRPG